MAANISSNGIIFMAHYTQAFIQSFISIQDKNQEFDKLISFVEFSMFVFPETSSALVEETNRIHKLKEKVRKRYPLKQLIALM